MTEGKPDLSHHPLAGTPVAAALFGALVDLMAELGGLVLYGRPGPDGVSDGLVSLALWRRTRASLRLAEGLFRRLLLARALPLVAALAGQQARRRPGRRAGDTPSARLDGGPEAQVATAHRPGPGPVAPARPTWRSVRLHETSLRTGPSATNARPGVGDVFGTLRRPLTAELLRYAALVEAIEAPDAATFRLARILLRRQRQAVAPGSDGPPAGSPAPQMAVGPSRSHPGDTLTTTDPGRAPGGQGPGAPIAPVSLDWCPQSGGKAGDGDGPPQGLAGLLFEHCRAIETALRPGPAGSGQAPSHRERLRTDPCAGTEDLTRGSGAERLIGASGLPDGGVGHAAGASGRGRGGTPAPAPT